MHCGMTRGIHCVPILRWRSLALIIAVWILLLDQVSPRAGAAAEAKDPEKQAEGDWVDARWNRVVLGSFQASLLPLPNGVIAKGLSVRLGDEGDAAVAYDTATATLRAGWSGGFVKFDGARYGLIHPPRPDGSIRFLAPTSPAWGDSPVRWKGLRTQGTRVVLDYEVNGVLVRESPWYTNGLFTRTLQIDPLPQPAMLNLLESSDRDLEVKTIEGVPVASLASKAGRVLVAVLGDPSAELRPAGRALKLQLRAGPSPHHLIIAIQSGSAGDSGANPEQNFARSVQHLAPPIDLANLAKPGPPRWRPLTTRGQRGFGNEAYVLDTLTVPYDNPYQALFFTSGVDFLPNGDAVVCTLHGDVWVVRGIDDSLQQLTWHRFATGLFQPLGLRVVQGVVYVLGRDRITALRDLNGDGEADVYESTYDGIQTSTGGHDYVTSLETDTNGTFYYVDPRGLHRVKADGSGAETVGAGWRNPNGIGVSPDGRILTVAPQEGEWTPSSAICEARPGGWYGYGGPKVTPERPLGFDPPLCWIPHRVDNSGGSQVWVTSGRWGPLADHFVHFSFGRCAQFLVLREVVDGVAQGAVAPLPGRFLSGAMRGAFRPQDGQLYVVGTRGWQTSAVRDGCLQRVRYTGKTPFVPVESHAHSNGLRLTFTAPLDRTAAEDVGSYGLSVWNYRYAARYGSQDYSVRSPNQEGHDALEIRSARLLADGRSVFLEIPALPPVMQWELKYNLTGPDAKPARGQLYGSIHRLAPPWSP